MVQLRYNNALGAIEALDDSSTTITFTVAPPFATLSGDEYIALTLDPPSSPSPSTSFERVYLTAYIEGETTGTIARGQEGTTPVAHSSSAVWMDAPSAADYSNAAMSPQTPVVARAYADSISPVANAWTKLPLDTITFDTAGAIDLTNHRFVAPVTGYYQFSGEVEEEGGNEQIALYLNGSEYSCGSGQAGGGWGTTINDIVYMTTGDYVELYYYTVSSMGSGYSGYNYLSVVLLSSLSSANVPITAKAYCNTDQSASGVWTKILLNVLDFDTASNMDVTTNHCFVCPETGYYEASGSVGSDIGAGNYAAIYKNGEGVVYGGSGTGRGTISSGAFFCNAGDHIELWGIASSGSLNNAEGAAMNYLSVSQVQGGVGNSSILLDFTQVTDISGLSIPEDTWTAIPATQYFTVVDGSVPIQICLSGCVQMYNGDNCGARVNIDSGAKTFLIGGYPGANSNVLAGAGTRFIPGGTLSAGVHSLDLEVYVLGSSSGAIYCRAASFPEIEGLTIQVVEF